MKNMSMKSILLSSFSVMVLAIAVIFGLAFIALGASSESIKEIEQTNALVADVTTTQKHILQAIGLAATYAITQDSTDFAKYQRVIDLAKQSIEEHKNSIKDKEVSLQIETIHQELLKYDTMIQANHGDVVSRSKSIQDTLLLQLDGLHQKILALQQEMIDKNKASIFAYESIMSVVGGVAMLLALFLAFFVSNFIVKNLSVIQNAAKELSSSDGDLTKRMPVIGKNEIGMLATQINHFIEKVQTTVRESKENGSENASVSAELSATALEVGNRAENEASLVANTSERAAEVFENLQAAVDRVNHSKENVHIAMTTLGDANSSINDLLETMNVTSSKEMELAQNMEQLQQEASSVKEVLAIIGDIADQTNLLALNAAIEAARAGEHGRGFAVVADEVRKLAERTQKSLTEITGTINLVIQSISDASGQMQSNTKDFGSAVQKVDEVSGQISSVNNALKDATHASNESAESSNTISKEMEAVIQNMREITVISTDNARSVEEIAGAAEHLSKLTEELNHTLDLFKA